MPLLSDKLSPLQKRVLEILADLNHPILVTFLIPLLIPLSPETGT